MINKVALIAVIVGLIVVSSVYYFSQPKSATVGCVPKNIGNSTLDSKFCVTEITMHSTYISSNYFVYTAITPSQLQQGYMNVSNTGDCNNKGRCIGMLFEFPSESSECFWMENTQIPLKQTWINASGYPVYTYNGTPLSTQAVCHDGKYVLETNPNFSVYGYITLNSS